MTDAEAELSYPLKDFSPEPGSATEILPGIFWVKIRQSAFLDHVNVWVMRDVFRGREGWTVIDAGVSQHRTIAQWSTIIAELIGDLPVLRVLVTHLHPDHIGLASWLCQKFEAPLWMSATDFFLSWAAHHSIFDFGGGSGAVDFHRCNGMTDPITLEHVHGLSRLYPRFVPEVQRSYRRVMQDDLISIGIRQFRCIMGFGHAPEHICLYCEDEDLLIGGDMVLPRISPIVTVSEFEPEGDPLGLFLRTLDRLHRLPEETFVLPSHGRPFYGLHTRIGQLRSHHEKRLALLRKACEGGQKSAVELASVLFGDIDDPDHRIYAFGETLAHLHYLWHNENFDRAIGEGQIWRFTAGTS